jgi:ABC-type dipeptide/oligopeptide/nickel transport system permease subunit
VKRPDTSLGFLIEAGKGEAQTKPYLFWWPVVLLCIISLTINFVGDGLRDAFDPRQNRVRA